MKNWKSFLPTKRLFGLLNVLSIDFSLLFFLLNCVCSLISFLSFELDFLEWLHIFLLTLTNSFICLCFDLRPDFFVFWGVFKVKMGLSLVLVQAILIGLHTKVFIFRCNHTNFFKLRCLHTNFLMLRCLHAKLLLHTRVLMLRFLHTRFLC